MNPVTFPSLEYRRRSFVPNLIAAFLCFILFGVLAAAYDSQTIRGMDNALTIGSGGDGWTTEVMTTVTQLGSEKVFAVLFVVAAGLLLLRRKFREALALLTALAGSYLLNTLLKNLIGRERPPLPHLVEVDGFSLPSGNAMIGMAFYGFLAYLLWRQRGGTAAWAKGLALLAAAAVVVVGVSRIYLHVHYPSDIIAGYLAGAGWLFLCTLIVAGTKNSF